MSLRKARRRRHKSTTFRGWIADSLRATSFHGPYRSTSYARFSCLVHKSRIAGWFCQYERCRPRALTHEIPFVHQREDAERHASVRQPVDQIIHAELVRLVGLIERPEAAAGPLPELRHVGVVVDDRHQPLARIVVLV